MKEKNLSMFAVVLAAFCSNASNLPAESLQAEFRSSDKSAFTAVGGGVKHGGLVWSWSSQGEQGIKLYAQSGSARPYYITNAFLRADGSYAPAVRFNRDLDNTSDIEGTPHQLVTNDGEETDLGFGSSPQGTWILVHRSLRTQHGGAVFGFKDGNSDNVNMRFGAFYLGSPDNTLRTHLCYNPANSSITTVTPVVNSMVSVRRSATRHMCWQNGALVNGFFTNNQSPWPQKQRFGMNFMVVDARSCSDIGTLAIWNRTLNDAEFRIAQTALAAQYGVELKNMLWQGAVDGYTEEIVGIGNSTASETLNDIPGSARESGSCGGLRLALVSGLTGDAEYIFAGRKEGYNRWVWKDGFVRTERVWRVERYTQASASARFVFSLKDAGLAKYNALQVNLLYRSNGDFQRLECPATFSQVNQTVHFTLSDETLKSGEYAIELVSGEESGAAMEGLVGWWRSDLGITAENGVVSKWSNQGVLGEELDVVSISNDVALVEDVMNGKPVLRFDGGGILQTAGKTHLGVGHDSTAVVVYRTTGNRADMGLFGLRSNDPRFGLFWAPADNVVNNADGTTTYKFNKARVFSFIGGNGVYVAPTPEGTGTRITSFLAKDAPDVVFYEGEDGWKGSTGARWAYSDVRVVDAPFMIGHFRADSSGSWWGKPLTGDIAELRVWNRALNEAELRVVQTALSARYGVPENGVAIDFGEDVVGVGTVATGENAGEVTVSDNCAGLRLVLLDNTTYGESFLFAGRNAEGSAWKLTRTGANVPVRLLFTPETSAQNWQLQYSADGENDWTAIVSSSTPSFDIEGTLESGWYRLAASEETVEARAEAPCAGISAGLEGWYRADGIDGDVWTDFAAKSSTLDMTRVEGTVSIAEENGVPWAVFNSAYFKTSIATTYGCSSEVTWFVVYNAAANADTKGLRLFGGASDNNRFGAFYTGSAFNYALRFQAFALNDTTKTQLHKILAPGTPWIIDARRNSGWLAGCVNGSQFGNVSYQFPSAVPQTMYIGSQITPATVSHFSGKIGEVRVYNRVLSIEERIIIYNHLSARYGISLDEHAHYSSQEWRFDVAGIGSYDSTGCTASDYCGGLCAIAQDTLDNGTWLLFGNNAGTGWDRADSTIPHLQRTWQFDATAMDETSVKLVFDFDKLGTSKRDANEKAAYKLLYRATANAAWQAQDVAAIEDGDKIHFTLPAGTVLSGFYTLGAEVTPRGTVVMLQGI